MNLFGFYKTVLVNLQKCIDGWKFTIILSESRFLS